MEKSDAQFRKRYFSLTILAMFLLNMGSNIKGGVKRTFVNAFIAKSANYQALSTEG